MSRHMCCLCISAYFRHGSSQWLLAKAFMLPAFSYHYVIAELLLACIIKCTYVSMNRKKEKKNTFQSFSSHARGKSFSQTTSEQNLEFLRIEKTKRKGKDTNHRQK